MLTNQVLQKITTDISKILDRDCSVWNISGKCLVATAQYGDSVRKDVLDFINRIITTDMCITKHATCFVVSHEDEPIYVLAIHGQVENAAITGKLCISQFENLIYAYRKRLDKNKFFQDLLLDNLLLVDVFNQAKKLNLDIEARRVVFVVQTKRETDNLLMETLKSLYATGTKDYVTSVDEGNIILIKTLEMTDDYKIVNDIAKTITDTLSAEVMVDIRVAYGTIVEDIKDVSKSYKEASMALDVGRIFYAEKNVLAYNELGIGRLIHQLPLSLCEMFLKEVFHGKAEKQFDKETLATVNAFFENNLNVSETARKMYLHRNTLGYRLDKIMKTTGLDVKKFDDALTFKIALMVSEHMKFIQSQD